MPKLIKKTIPITNAEIICTNEEATYLTSRFFDFEKPLTDKKILKQVEEKLQEEGLKPLKVKSKKTVLVTYTMDMATFMLHANQIIEEE